LGIAALLAATGLEPVRPDSPNTERIVDLFWFVSFWAAVVLLAVAIPLVYFVWRYRGRGRPRTVEGPQVHGSTRLEIAWTIVPVVILLIVSIYTFYKLPGISLEAAAGEQSLEVVVEGRQFYWQYRYPNGVIAIDTLRAPADRLVELRITAPDSDVIHSYWIPNLFAKVDAIPGRETRTAFRSPPGTYEGQCAEFCGIQHAEMFGTIEVLPADEFDAWLEEEARAQETGDSDLGEQIFNGACAKCHGDQGQGLIGPGFSASTVSSPASVEEIVRNGRGKMPVVGEEWSDQQMKALTDYLRQRFGQQEGSSGG
jgi:cytochrome c oxidase subunit 2